MNALVLFARPYHGNFYACIRKALCCLIFFSVGAYLAAGEATADTIELRCEAAVRIDADLGRVELIADVSNIGPTPVQHLSVSLLDGSEEIAPIEPAAAKDSPASPPQSLYPNRSLQLRSVVSGDHLPFPLPGKYLVPYRLKYEDVNSFPYSTPFFATVTIPPVPSESLRAVLQGAPFGEELSLSGGEPLELAFTLQNYGAAPVEVRRALLIGGFELDGTIHKQLPFTLEPHSSSELKVTVRSSEAQPGARLTFSLLVSGEQANLQTDTASPLYAARVVRAGPNLRLILAAFALAAALITSISGISHQT